MTKVTDVEVCLEINRDTEESILPITQRYEDGLITRQHMAQEISLVIYSFLMKNEPILVKILRRP